MMNLKIDDDKGKIMSETEGKSKIHMCINCRYHIATCYTSDIAFGDGIGNDNVIRCAGYMERV